MSWQHLAPSMPGNLQTPLQWVGGWLSGVGEGTVGDKLLGGPGWLGRGERPISKGTGTQTLASVGIPAAPS